MSISLAAIAVTPGLSNAAGVSAAAAVQPSDTTTIFLDFQNLSTVQNHPLFLRFIDRSSGMEVIRVEVDSLAADSDVPIHGVGVGKTYVLEFFSDQNDNRKYDGNTTDKAWRTTVGPVLKTMEFLIPANLPETAITWPYTVTVHQTGLTQVSGKRMELRLVETPTGKEVSRVTVNTVSDADSTITIPGAMIGRNYQLDIWSDTNGNGRYDTPPTDQSWRIPVNDVQGNTTVQLTAATPVVALQWPYLLTLELRGMTPNLGQKMFFRLVRADSATGPLSNNVVATTVIDSVAADTLFVRIPGLAIGQTYHVDFFADVNKNGKYDKPPVDNAWRITFNDTEGDTTLVFDRTTDFTDIQFANLLTLELRGMTPNLGQKMFFRLVREDSLMDSPARKEVARAVIDSVAADTLFIQLPGLAPGLTYHVDFFADVNKNGRYDKPPADNAWRMVFTDTGGDTTLVFDRTNVFTDIQWPNLVTLNLRNMTPEIGKHMDFRMVEANTDSEVYRTQIDSVRTADFTVQLPGTLPGMTYHIDFFSDANGNAAYDTPPADHAWRITLDSTATDTTLVFQHTTTYTDIGWTGPVGVEEDNALPAAFALYQNAPNPFNPSTVITFELSLNSAAKLEIFNIAGQKVRTLVDGKLVPGKYSFTWDGRDNRGAALSSGVYFYRLQTETMNKAMRMLLLK